MPDRRQNPGGSSHQRAVQQMAKEEGIPIVRSGGAAPNNEPIKYQAARGLFNWVFGTHTFDLAATACIGFGIGMALSSDPKDVHISMWSSH
jgi:hypothetical protein